VNLVIPILKHRQWGRIFFRRPVVAHSKDQSCIWPYLRPESESVGVDPRYPVVVYASGRDERSIADVSLNSDDALPRSGSDGTR
jgi:hypothetical protein